MLLSVKDPSRIYELLVFTAIAKMIVKYSNYKINYKKYTFGNTILRCLILKKAPRL